MKTKNGDEIPEKWEILYSNCSLHRSENSEDATTCELIEEVSHLKAVISFAGSVVTEQRKALIDAAPVLAAQKGSKR